MNIMNIMQKLSRQFWPEAKMSNGVQSVGKRRSRADNNVVVDEDLSQASLQKLIEAHLELIEQLNNETRGQTRKITSLQKEMNKISHERDELARQVDEYRHKVVVMENEMLTLSESLRRPPVEERGSQTDLPASRRRTLSIQSSELSRKSVKHEPVQLPVGQVISAARDIESDDVEPGIEMSETLYYCYALRDERDPNPVDDVSVPRWRELRLSTLHSANGEAEDMSDEKYEKRHKRPEADEKRRKRWDLQRWREIQMRNRLLKTYKKSPLELAGGAMAGAVVEPEEEGQLQDKVRIVEVTNGPVPVSAFGVPIPLVEAKDFLLPWEHEVSVSKAKKRKTQRS